MPAWIVQEWAEYWELEPWGAWRDNFHASLIATVIARVNGVKSINAADFFYKVPDDERQGAERATALFSWLRSVAVKQEAVG